MGVWEETRRPSFDSAPAAGPDGGADQQEQFLDRQPSMEDKDEQDENQRKAQQQQQQQQEQKQQDQQQQDPQEQQQSIGCKRLATVTVGLKPSRAYYCISNEKEAEQILVLLAALTITNNDRFRQHLIRAQKHQQHHLHQYHYNLFSPKGASIPFIPKSHISSAGANNRGLPVKAVTGSSSSTKQQTAASNTYQFNNICKHPESQKFIVCLVASSLCNENMKQQNQNHGYSSPTRYANAKRQHNRSVKSPASQSYNRTASSPNNKNKSEILNNNKQ